MINLPPPLRAAATTVATSQQKAHISSVIAVLYSLQFQQLITVCSNENVHVWDLFSASSSASSSSHSPVFDFVTSHKAQLTAAALDWHSKRLLTACHRGGNEEASACV